MVKHTIMIYSVYSTHHTAVMEVAKERYELAGGLSKKHLDNFNM